MHSLVKHLDFSSDDEFFISYVNCLVLMFMLFFDSKLKIRLWKIDWDYLFGK